MPPKQESYGAHRRFDNIRSPLFHTEKSVRYQRRISRMEIFRIVSSCFIMMRQIRRRFISRPALLSLVVSVVFNQLDYSSVILAGLPRTQLDRLKYVLNTAARLVYSSRKYDIITPLLHELHWLRTYKCRSALTFDWQLLSTTVYLVRVCGTYRVTSIL